VASRKQQLAPFLARAYIRLTFLDIVTTLRLVPGTGPAPPLDTPVRRAHRLLGMSGFYYGARVADIAELTRLIEPEAEAEGLALVRVKMIGGASDPTLQVMAERIARGFRGGCRISSTRSRPKGATQSRKATGSRSARPGSTGR